MVASVPFGSVERTKYETPENLELDSMQRLTPSYSFAHSCEFEEVEKLGKGSVGSVYQLFHRASGLFVAVKKVSCSECDMKATEREIEFMKSFNCSYIIRYFSDFVEGDTWWVWATSERTTHSSRLSWSTVLSGR